MALINMRVSMPDRTGMLAAVASAISEENVDIVTIEVVHHADGLVVDNLCIDIRSTTPSALRRRVEQVPGVVVEVVRSVAAPPTSVDALELAASLVENARSPSRDPRRRPPRCARCRVGDGAGVARRRRPPAARQRSGHPIRRKGRALDAAGGSTQARRRAVDADVVAAEVHGGWRAWRSPPAPFRHRSKRWRWPGAAGASAPGATSTGDPRPACDPGPRGRSPGACRDRRRLTEPWAGRRPIRRPVVIVGGVGRSMSGPLHHSAFDRDAGRAALFVWAARPASTEVTGTGVGPRRTSRSCTGPCAVRPVRRRRRRPRGTPRRPMSAAAGSRRGEPRRS